ncbi:hypothetical protein NOVO_07335 [Rickettsiales bacterium Ac37b]|nr:hypothetical protein NOVO_07335 [Rickettsiales bacterium Ac37b]
MLEEETGLWYQVDLHYLDHDLESLRSNYNQNDIEEALNNLLSGKLEDFTINPKLKEDLEEIQNILIPDEIKNSFYKKVINDRTTRSGDNKPSLPYLIEAAKFYIYEKLKNEGIDLKVPTLSQKFKDENSLEPTIWDKPAPSMQAIDEECSKILQVDYLRDIENGDTRENSFVKTAGINHRQDNKAWFDGSVSGRITLSLELTEVEAAQLNEYYKNKVPNLIREYYPDNDPNLPGSNYRFILDSRVFYHEALPIMTKENIKNLEFNNPRVEARYHSELSKLLITKCREVLQLDIHKDIENGEALENSFVKTTGINHRQDKKSHFDTTNQGKIEFFLELTENEAKQICDFYTKNVPGLIKQHSSITAPNSSNYNYHFILDLDIFFHKALPIMTKEDIKNLEFNTPQVEARYQRYHRRPMHNNIEFDMPQAEDEVDGNRQNGTHVQRLLSTRQVNGAESNSHAERVLNSRNEQNGIPRH